MRGFAVGDRIMPSLQDGGALAGTDSPGFTRGYFHSLPPGARSARKGYMLGGFAGFHPGLFSFAPSGSEECAEGIYVGRIRRVSPGAIFIRSLWERGARGTVSGADQRTGCAT